MKMKFICLYGVFLYALSPTMCKFIREHHCWVFSP